MSLLAAYYADDFTGATDALDALSRAGLSTDLYLSPPSPVDVKDGVDVVGVAGATRSMGPDRMRSVLSPELTALRALEPAFLHYKVCSTFDSSRRRGNLGVVEAIGHELCGGETPVIVGTTRLGRYVVFGELFARYGDGTVHRIDRHPVMAHHPVTPMTEASIARHLATMSDVAARNVTTVDYARESRGSLAPREKRGFVIYDTVHDGDSRALADIVAVDARTDTTPRFVIGSSGATDVIAMGRAPRAPVTVGAAVRLPEAVDQLLVISGSRSPSTRAQIDRAADAGFAVVPVDFTDSQWASSTFRNAKRQLRKGRSTIVDTARCETRLDAETISHALAELTGDLLDAHPVPRTVICGGDTSSVIGQTLGIRRIRFRASLAPGAPLCAVDTPKLSQVAFKGGQMGGVDYLLCALGPLTARFPPHDYPSHESELP